MQFIAAQPHAALHRLSPHTIVEFGLPLRGKAHKKQASYGLEPTAF